MIRKLIAQFERTGSVHDLLGRVPKHSMHYDAAVEAVWQGVLEDPSVSTYHHSAQLGIARTPFQMMKMDLKMFSYKN